MGELGNNRALAKSVIEQLTILISNAVKCRVTGAKCSNVHQILLDNIETVNLMNMINTLSYIQIIHGGSKKGFFQEV